MDAGQLGDLIGRNLLSIIILGVGFYYGYKQMSKWIKNRKKN